MKMSKKGLARFAKHARVVLPWDKFFLPDDYVVEFNRGRKTTLSAGVFKKYLATSFTSSSFPELLRERENHRSPYLYYLDSDVESPRISNAPDKKSKESFKKNLLPPGLPISGEAIVAFIARVKPLFSSERWCSPKTLHRKYSAVGYRKISRTTFSYYMSSVQRSDMWKGLERRKGRGNMYEYRWVVPEGESTVTVTPPLEVEESPVPVTNTCGSCNGESPQVALFCMHCGSSLSLLIRVVVQEGVHNISIPNKILGSMEDPSVSSSRIVELVRQWACARISATLMEEGENVVTVWLDQDKGE